MFKSNLLNIIPSKLLLLYNYNEMGLRKSLKLYHHNYIIKSSLHKIKNKFYICLYPEFSKIPFIIKNQKLRKNSRVLNSWIISIYSFYD